MSEPRKTIGVVEQVATSMALQAFNRVVVPMLVAGALWMIAHAVEMDRRVTLVERSFDTHNTRVARLEGLRETDQQRIAQVQSELTSVLNNLRSDIAALRADQAAMLRAVSRLETLSERANGAQR